MRKPIIAPMRAFTYMVAVSPLIALAASILSPSPADTFRVLARKWDVVCDLSSPLSSQGQGNYYLIDRQSGEANPLVFPEQEHWGMVSVSPWGDPEGNAEAVGQCYSPSATGGGGTFWGLARLSLPRAELIDKVQLDLLPTSRPCWVPGRPGAILFAAGDGQLHRFDFSDQPANADGSDPQSRDHSPAPAPRAVTWKARRPCKGAVFLTDPVWPGHPAFPQIVLATLISAPLPSEAPAHRPTSSGG